MGGVVDLLSCSSVSKVSKFECSNSESNSVHSACVAALMRMYYTVDSTHHPHDTRSTIALGNWIQIEICCGLLVACMPTLPRFFKHPPLSSGLKAMVGHLRQSRRTRSIEIASNDRDSEDPAPQKRTVITDIEFEELVRQSNLSANSSHGHLER